MTATQAAVPLIEDLTPTWLSTALGAHVESVASERIGTGQLSTCYRLQLTGDPALPATVLAKLPAIEPADREMLAVAYANEVRFYRDIAATVDVVAPTCHYAALGEAGTFTLLLEDLDDAVAGDQIEGCSPGQALAAARNLAGLHGPRWGDPSLLEIEGMMLPDAELAAMADTTYPDATATFLEWMSDRLAPEDVATLAELAPLAGRWITGRSARYAILHMDYRLDNLMFHADGRLSAVDWQGLSIGLPARDLAFLLGTGLSVADRRAEERSIVAAYHERLLSYGVEDHSLEECWDDYRFGMMQAAFITVFGCVYGTRTERGDEMFLAMTRRFCPALRDLDTIALVRSS